jgi:hypothetical protein
MAWLLAQAQARQGWSEAQVAAQLGLAPGQLPRLALYLRCRPDHFAEDVAAIAAQVGCEPAALANVVRQASADESSNS